MEGDAPKSPRRARHSSVHEKENEDPLQELRDLSAQLASARDVERETMAKIAALEAQREQYRLERRKLLENARRMIQSSKLDRETSKLKKEVEDLSAAFAQVSIKHQEMKDKATETEVSTKKRIAECERKKNELRQKLDTEREEEDIRLQNIDHMKQKIAEMKEEVESLDAERAEASAVYKETIFQRDQLQTRLIKQEDAIKELTEDIEDLKKQEFDLREDKARRKKVRRRGNKDINDVYDVIEELRAERQLLREKVCALEEQELADLQYELKRVTTELSHLMEVHQSRCLQIQEFMRHQK